VYLCGDEPRSPGGDVGGVALASGGDQLRSAIYADDDAASQLLTDQGHRGAVAAAQLQHSVPRLNVQPVDRPSLPIRCLAGAHAPRIETWWAWMNQRLSSHRRMEWPVGMMVS
jgi:hypothetical protein